MSNEEQQAVFVSAASDTSTMVETVKISMRSYLSSHFLWSARHDAALAKKVESENAGAAPIFLLQHRAHVCSSILSATAFIESAINELFQDVADGHSSYVGSLGEAARISMKTFWHVSDGAGKRIQALGKYNMALALNNRPPLDRGADPYQAAQLLTSLRNWLVHYYPESIDLDNPHKLEDKLRGRFSENQLLVGSGNPWFPDKALSADCAKWACASAVALADRLTKLLQIKLNYQIVEFQPLPEEV